MATRLVSEARQLVRDFGTSIQFTGGTSNVACGSGSSLQVSNNFTISFWFKFSNRSASQQWLFKKTGSGGNTSYAVLYNYTSNQLEFYSTGYTGTKPGYDSAITRIPVTNNGWNHIAYSYDGTTWDGFLNGERVFHNTITFSVNNGSGSLVLGCSSSGSNQYYGFLDEFKIYNIGLTHDEIRQIYTKGQEPKAENLKLYYKFDEGSGSSVTDHSGNGNTGTITTATYSSDVFMTPRSAISSPRITLRDFQYCLQNPRANIGIVNSLNFERTDPFSISAWVYATGTAAKVIVDHQNYSAPYTGYVFAISATGKLYTQMINHYGNNNYLDVNGNKVITDGKWHHCVMTYSGSSNVAGVKFYVDRVLNTNTTVKDTLSASIAYDATFYLGHNNGFSSLTGNINDFQIYTSVLTQSQIDDIYYLGYSNISSFVNWWKINEGVGLSITDYKGGNTATITSGTWVSKGYIKTRTQL